MKLVLENYATIYTAMRAKRIELDFSKSEHNICLIVGPNGSGKTSILSSLHPFATLGNLDIRDKQNLILAGETGSKEIDILYNGDIYHISHIYSPVKDKNHTVKSYIEVNGEELNVNGNNRSFKEIIKDIFGIDMDYLKLIRLGDNVKSMIDLSETDRKSFMTKLMDDLDIFLKYYTKIMQDLRQLKAMISHSVNKLAGLSITDLDETNKEIDEINNTISVLSISIDNINQKIGEIKASISDIKDDPDKIVSMIKEIKPTYDKFKKKRGNIEISIDDCDELIQKRKIFAASAEERLNSITAKKNSLNREGAALRKNLQYLKYRENEYNHKEDEAEKELKSKEYYEKLISDNNKRIKSFVPAFERADLEHFMSVLMLMQEKLEKVYELGQRPIKIVVDMMRDNKNIDAYITQLSLKVNESSTGNSEIRDFIKTLANDYNFSQSYKSPCTQDMSRGCEALQLHNHLSALFQEQVLAANDYEMLDYVKAVYNAIKYVFTELHNNEGFIDLLPPKFKDAFLLETVYDKLEHLQPIYNVSKYNTLLSKTVDFYNNIEYKKEITNIDKRISSILDGSYMDIDSIHSEMKTLQKEIDDIDAEYNELTDEHASIEDKLDSARKDIEVLSETYEILNNYQSVCETYDRLIKDKERLNKAYKDLDDQYAIIHENENAINKYRSKLMKLASQKSQYIEIQKDISAFTLIYDEMVLLKRALSSKEGIPLQFMNHYLGNIEDVTNELLDIVYDGDIQIDHFNITANEFSIPFYNKGTWLRDVTLASQGELSFLSIALSFALSSQIISDYNIMLFDEIDGALDTTNRAKFIQILESQISKIGSEQNFLITHNDMFSSYPIDIIDLSFGKESSDKKYKLANNIPVKLN